MNEELRLDEELKNLMGIIRKNINIILLVTFIFTAAAYFISFFYLKPSYETKVIIVPGITSGSNTENVYNNMAFNDDLLNTYCYIAKTKDLAEKAINKYNLGLSTDYFLKTVKVQLEKDAKIIVIKVTGDTPKQVYNIANALSSTFIEEINKIYPSSNLGIFDSIKMPSEPVKANIIITLAIGSLLGFFTGILLILVINYFDTSIKTERDVEEYLGLNAIGAIPKTRELEKRNKIDILRKKIPQISEAFIGIGVMLGLFDENNKIKTLMIVSANPREGKTTAAAGLSIAMARLGKKVLLIDCNMRNPDVHNLFNISNEKGLSQVLQGQVSWIEAKQNTEEKSLYILSSGTYLENPTELFCSSRTKRFIETVKSQFDYVIFDTPSINRGAESYILAPQLDGCILIVDSGATERESAIKTTEQLKHINANIVGVSLNKVLSGKKKEKDSIAENTSDKLTRVKKRRTKRTFSME